MAFDSRFSWFGRAICGSLLGLVVACGDSGTNTSATTSGPGTTGTTAGTTSGETTGTTAGTSEPVTTSATGGQTGGETTAGTTSGETTAGTTTMPLTTGETTGSTSESTGSTTETTGSTTEMTTGTTGEPPGATCVQDSDCMIHTDCCNCDVIAKDETPPGCNIMECLIDTCSTLDVGKSKPVCRFGRCTFSKVHCNPTGVLCDVAPPNCPPTQLPSVTEDGTCYTGQCAPAEACDWSPDCEHCLDKEDPLVCVLKLQKGPFHVCEPKPADCGPGDIDCGCGTQICEMSPPHTECSDQNVGIACECPFC